MIKRLVALELAPTPPAAAARPLYQDKMRQEIEMYLQIQIQTQIQIQIQIQIQELRWRLPGNILICELQNHERVHTMKQTSSPVANQANQQRQQRSTF